MNCSQPKTIYQPWFKFSFEADYNYCHIQPWFLNNFHKYIYYVLATYLVLVFSLKHLMKNRKPFLLREPLILWNLCLTIFSLMGAIRSVAELVSMASDQGFKATICDNSCYYGPNGLWMLLFSVSKVPEMIDTIFIVLRKRPLIFLHWYHHLETAYYCLISMGYGSGFTRWFVAMNFSVHTIMYGYYFLRAAGIKVPRQVAPLITSLQCAQMFVGLAIAVSALVLKSTQPNCYHLSSVIVYMGIATYLIYCYLFSKYFIDSYFKGAKKIQVLKESVKDNNNVENIMQKKIK